MTPRKPLALLTALLLPLIARSADEADSNAETPREAAAHLVIVIGEHEYDTRTTLPAFAASELEPRGLRVTLVHASSGDPNHFPGLEALTARAARAHPSLPRPRQGARRHSNVEPRLRPRAADRARAVGELRP